MNHDYESFMKTKYDELLNDRTVSELVLNTDFGDCIPGCAVCCYMKKSTFGWIYDNKFVDFLDKLSNDFKDVKSFKKGFDIDFATDSESMYSFPTSCKFNFIEMGTHLSLCSIYDDRPKMCGDHKCFSQVMLRRINEVIPVKEALKINYSKLLENKIGINQDHGSICNHKLITDKILNSINNHNGSVSISSEDLGSIIHQAYIKMYDLNKRFSDEDKVLGNEFADIFKSFAGMKKSLINDLKREIPDISFEKSGIDVLILELDVPKARDSISSNNPDRILDFLILKHELLMKDPEFMKNHIRFNEIKKEREKIKSSYDSEEKETLNRIVQEITK